MKELQVAVDNIDCVYGDLPRTEAISSAWSRVRPALRYNEEKESL